MANNQQHQPSVDDFRKYLHPRWLNETDRRDSEVSTASAGTSADQSFWEGHRDSAATVDTVYTRKGSVASKAEGYATVSIEPLQRTRLRGKSSKVSFRTPFADTERPSPIVEDSSSEASYSTSSRPKIILHEPQSPFEDQVETNPFELTSSDRSEVSSISAPDSVYSPYDSTIDNPDQIEVVARDYGTDLRVPLSTSIPAFAERPLTLPIPTFGEKPLTPVQEKEEFPVSEVGPPVNTLREKIAEWCQHNYMLVREPELILPSAPSDEEKLSFLQIHRFWLCSTGLLSFLGSSAGIWLFALCSPIFYWFAIPAAFLQLYLSLFHLTGIFSNDFDHKEHLQALADYPLDENAPTVDIYLPCCKEPLMILENTYRYIRQLEYPAGRMKVHVLDDGAMDEVKALAEKYGFNYIVREDRPRLKKAGNLRWAFARTSGEFFVIYDADFCPRRDYLTELIPRMMANPNIAIIQTPQYFRTLDTQTWVERGAGAVQELFYRYIQVNRNKWNGAICVGSNATYRREALKDTGGTAEVGASEDVHTGFYAVTRGWRLFYIPLALACGVCPDNPRAFFSQQLRWCQGSTSLLLNWEFWTSNLTVKQKLCYLSGMMYYSASSLQIFINPLPGILLIWFRPEFVKWWNLAFALPALFYGWGLYRFWGRSHHAKTVQLISVMQSYAYLSALKDRVLGTSFTWVPSGDNKAHRSTRYRNMRWFAIGWTTTYNILFFSGTIFRIQQGWPWYDYFPLILLEVYMIYKTMPYLLAA